MRDKVSYYLGQHLSGEVMTSADALDYFSTDGSVFKIRPKVVVYPRSTQDVRKVARFTWQMAERGHTMPITARGKGTDLGGAAIGEGIVMVFPAHMNKILEINKDIVVVQPGITYAKLEQALHTHYRFLPPYPASAEYSTLGGAVANNASGEKSVKYGDTRAYVKGLRVVLANGEVIDTGPLSKKELSKKTGQTNLEGAIYRGLDTIIDGNPQLIESIGSKGLSKNTAGYALHLIKNKNQFDLTPLIVGSQGTLGLVTEAHITTEAYNPHTTLCVGLFKSISELTNAVLEIKRLNPASLEMVDQHLLNFVRDHHPSQLPDILTSPFPQAVLLVEFDDLKDGAQRKKAKALVKIFEKYCKSYATTSDENEKDKLWKIRHSAATVVWQSVGTAKALPFIEDGVVPVEKLSEYIAKVYQLFAKHHLDVAIWGHAGDGNLHIQPYLDLATVGDKQRLFKLADEYYQLLNELGGSSSGEHGDGRIRAPYLSKVYGEQVYDLFKQVKKLFDPHGTLNPGVKFSTDKSELQKHLRTDYSVEHMYDHMPRL